MNRMKLLVLIPIVIVLAAYAYLGIEYAGNKRARDRLVGEIGQAQEAMTEAGQVPKSLDELLSEARATLAAVQDELPDEVDTTGVIGSILEIASRAGLGVFPLTTSPMAAEVAGENEYQVFNLGLEVAGSYDQIVSFVADLEDGGIKGLAVQGLTLSEAPDGGIMTARLSLAVYAHTGDPEEGI